MNSSVNHPLDAQPKATGPSRRGFIQSTASVAVGSLAASAVLLHSDLIRGMNHAELWWG